MAEAEPQYLVKLNCVASSLSAPQTGGYCVKTQGMKFNWAKFNFNPCIPFSSSILKNCLFYVFIFLYFTTLLDIALRLKNNGGCKSYSKIVSLLESKLKQYGTISYIL